MKTANKYIEPTDAPAQPKPDAKGRMTVHFDVSGRFVTKTARDMWAGDEEAHAIGVLVEGMNGMTEKIALDILEGRKILSGWNDKVELLDDNEPMPTFDQIIEKKQNYYEQAFKNYSELLVSIRSRNFKAISKKYLTEEDEVKYQMHTEGMQFPAFASMALGKTKYDKLKKADEIINAIKGVNKLLVTNTCLILDNIRDAIEEMDAIEEVIDYHTSAMKKAAARPRKEETSQTFHEPTDVFESLRREAQARLAIGMRNMKADGSFSDEVIKESAERLRRGVDGVIGMFRGDLDKKPDREFRTDTGWLSPIGDYFSCEIVQHIALANELAGCDRGEEKLENEGWIKVSGRQWHSPEGTKLTKKQLNSIFDWCVKHGQEFRWNGKKMTYTELLEQEGK